MPTPTEQYMLDYFDGLQDLEAKRDDFQDEASDPRATDSERATAAAGYLDMVDIIGRFKLAHEAFMHRYGPTSTGPTSDIVAQADILHESVGTIIANAATEVALIHSLTNFVNKWNALSGGNALGTDGSGAGVAAAAATGASSGTNLSFLAQRVV